MQIINHESQTVATNSKNQRKYEIPAIIYEGTITTRAGSPAGGGDEGVDPADLFGNDD